MFERRLRVFFGALVLVTVVLVLRASQLQLLRGGEFREESAKSMTRTTILETVRGRIVDFKDRELAIDKPCVDAAVDFRAIVRDAKWMADTAKARLKARDPEGYARAGRLGRVRLIEQEVKRVNADLDAMWRTLATVGRMSAEQMEETRAAVQLRVEWRRRLVWYSRYAKAARQQEQQPPEPWFMDWMLNGAKDPELDSFRIEVAEQLVPHVILHNISIEDANGLKKQQDSLPGLVVQPGKFRYYPYGPSACHTLGHLSTVIEKDLATDVNAHDELRAYGRNDVIGRDGVEGICDQVLRGVRGRIVTDGRGNTIESQSVEPIPGRSVKLGIDIELQMDIERAFSKVDFRDSDGNVVESHEAYGAAVVIDLPTGQLRALASYPTYDLNKFQELYPLLKDSADPINRKLLNRATQLALEPGSTVKPMVGIGAITDGIIGLNQTIECLGYLHLNGKEQPFGRCWVAKTYGERFGKEWVKHHANVPTGFGHPTGHLTFGDALQRSCNVFFETVGYRMGVAELAKWYRLFGLGRRTGIGVPESAGRVPDPQSAQAEWVRLFCAIGQTEVLATPLQMANVAATIARDGIWLRPTLLVNKDDRNPAIRPIDAAQAASTRPAEPDRVDLHLDAAAVKAARDGMSRAVNTRAGTAHGIDPPQNLVIAGKTGTAQASRFKYRQRQPDGTYKIVFAELSTLRRPNPKMPWYRGSGLTGESLTHAWFIGYVPADKPRLAFAVMLEYGGGGGADSAPIVRAVLDACAKHKYLEPGQ